MPEIDAGVNYEVDPDFLEHVQNQAYDQPELTWEPSTSPEHARFRP